MPHPLKDYESVIVWLDYFNKTLPRSKGRRLGRDDCVFDPSLNEMTDAAKAAGCEIVETGDTKRFPRRAYVRSGYLAVKKTGPKTATIRRISKKLLERRKKQK